MDCMCANMDIQNFAFVKTIDTESLNNAIIFVNRSRRHPFTYKRITQTAPRDGWSALIIHHTAPDHYLMRNISGRMGVRVFELGTNGFSMMYRVHQSGKTISAFESHLALWVTQQLRALMATSNMSQIDLAEPAGRWILRRFHEYQRAWSWSASKANESVTPELQRYYAANAEDLKDYVRNSTDLDYVRDLVKPGFSTNEAFERLLEVIELPYLSGSPVIAEVQGTTDVSATASATEAPPEQQRTLRGPEILQPSTWNDQLVLPRGWVAITEDQWKSEPSKHTTPPQRALKA